MNRKERRAQASVLRSEGKVQEKKEVLIKQYSQLAMQAGDLQYRLYVINKDMEDIQRQHAALVAAEPKKETQDAKPATAPEAPTAPAIPSGNG